MKKAESLLNGPGHVTKMAAMPIYGKNPVKSSSLYEIMINSGLGLRWTLQDHWSSGCLF